MVFQMMKKISPQQRWCALLLGAVLGLVGCHHTPDEVQVRRNVAAAATAAEQSDTKALGALISDDFNGNTGGLNKDMLLTLVRMQGLQGQNTSVMVGALSVEEQGGRYLVNFNATRISGPSVLSKSLGTYHVQTAWRKDDGVWRCYWATWDRTL